MATAIDPRRSTEPRVTEATKYREQVERWILEYLSSHSDTSPVKLLDELEARAGGTSVIRKALWNLVDKGQIRLSEDLTISTKRP